MKKGRSGRVDCSQRTQPYTSVTLFPQESAPALPLMEDFSAMEESRGPTSEDELSKLRPMRIEVFASHIKSFTRAQSPRQCFKASANDAPRVEEPWQATSCSGSEPRPPSERLGCGMPLRNACTVPDTHSRIS